jgi:hypothetical protein
MTEQLEQRRASCTAPSSGSRGYSRTRSNSCRRAGVITENSGRTPELCFDQLMLAKASVLTDFPHFTGPDRDPNYSGSRSDLLISTARQRLD